VAVASAGPYASLHLAPDRQPHQHPTTVFLQVGTVGCPSCRPSNSVKALKAILQVQIYKNNQVVVLSQLNSNTLCYCTRHKQLSIFKKQQISAKGLA